MQKVENIFIEQARQANKSAPEINWDALKQDYPDMDTSYIRKQLRGKKMYAEPVGPKRESWWQKELESAKEIAKFPYTITKEITYPMAKGIVRVPFVSREEAKRISHEEIEPVAQMGIAMGKGFGGGLLDWLKYSLLKDTPAGIIAQQRIGERIKEHGYLAEAIYPAAILGLAKGATGVAGKLRPKKAVIRQRLRQIEELEIPTAKEKPVQAVKTLINELEPFEVEAIKKGMRKQHIEWMQMRKRAKAVEREGVEVKPEEVRGEGFVVKPEQKLLTSRLHERLRAIEEMEFPKKKPTIKERLAQIERMEVPPKKGVTEKPAQTEIELYAGLPLGKMVPESIKRFGKRIFYQFRNRVKHPLSKQTVDEIYGAFGERGRLVGTYQERARKMGLWDLTNKQADQLTAYRLNPGKVKVMPRLKEVGEGVDAMFNEMFETLDQLGIKVTLKDKTLRPIGKVKNYVPRKMRVEVAREMWDDILGFTKEAKRAAKESGKLEDQVVANIANAWYQNSKFKPEAMKSIGHLIRTKQAKTPAEAIAILDNYSFNDLYRPFVNIERPRILELPPEFYETNMKKIVASYIAGFAKRVPEIKRWGQEGRVITNRLSQLTKEGLTEESALLRDMVQTFTGAVEKTKGISPEFRRFTEAYTGYQVAAKIGLGTASIPQVTQPTISFIPLTRIVDWTRAGLDLFSKANREWVRETGAPGFEQMKSITGMRPQGKMGALAEITTKGSLFQSLNKGLQYWAAASGRRWLTHLHELAQSPNKLRRGFARRQLKDWGVNPDKPLTENVLKESSYRFAMDTQLQRNMIKEAPWMNAPQWRWASLFKRFPYRQFNLFKDHMWREVKHGNPLPILKLVVGGAIGGEFVVWAKDKLRETLTGRPYYREEDLWTWHRLINNLAAVGTMGWVTDLGRVDELTPITIIKDIWRTGWFQIKPVGVSDIERTKKIGDQFVEALDKRGLQQAMRRAAPYIVGTVGGVLANYFKERLKTPQQFDATMKFFKREVNQRALKACAEGNYDEGYGMIEKWNYNNPDYMLDYPKYKDVKRFRKHRQELREGK